MARKVGDMIRRWKALLPNDPLYNPDLTLLGRDFTLACPSRRAKTWAQPAA